MRRFGILLAIAIVVGCGGSTPNPTSTSTTGAQPPPILPAADMQYVLDDKGTLVVSLSVHADGRIDAHGRMSARIDGGRIVCADGREMLRVDEKGDVVIEEKIVGHLLADGSFAMDRHFGEWSVTVRDDGDVVLTTKAEGAASTHALRWQPFHVEARRTASLLTGFLTPPFAGMWCGEERPTQPQ